MPSLARHVYFFGQGRADGSAAMRDVLTRMVALAGKLLRGEEIGPPAEAGYLPRGLLLEGELRQPDLQTLAARRPLFVEMDVRVPPALYETIVDLNKYLATHNTGLDFPKVVAQVGSPDVKGILSSLLGEMAVPEPAYRQALTVERPKLQAAYADYFKRERVEAVIFPTTPLPAAKIGEDETVMLNGAAVPTFATFSIASTKSAGASVTCHGSGRPPSWRSVSRVTSARSHAPSSTDRIGPEAWTTA